jgi:hypothetical protein
VGTPVEEFAAFNITEALEIAEAEFERYGRENEETTLEMDGVPHLTVRGWWRIILHEEKRIKALKRQVNRLIAGNTIEGDDIPYPEEDC